MMSPEIPAPLLRRALYHNAEFSVGDDLGSYGVMVPADGQILSEVAEWVAKCPYADDWFVAVRRLTDQVAPDAALFRADTSGHAVMALTWYLRFPRQPAGDEFRLAMRFARPWRWRGPDLAPVADALNVAGPRGVALRVDARGRTNTAVYFRVAEGWAGSSPANAAKLLTASGLTAHHAECVAQDVAATCPNGTVGVVGIEEGVGDSAAAALKLDPEGVPLPAALELLDRKCVAPAARRRVQYFATGLRARTLSYLGMKYTSQGFAGWRAYFSCEPVRSARAAAVQVALAAAPCGRVRLPQY
jgi:hypothetical protein